MRSGYYSRAFYRLQRLQFGSHSEKLAISIRAPFFVRRVLFFLENAQWNKSIAVLDMYLPFCMGESDNSFKKTFCLEYSPSRPPV